MFIFWLIIGFLVIVIGCIFVYNTAKHDELHNMRAAFIKYENNFLNKYIDLPKQEIQLNSLKKILKILEELENIIEEEEESIDPKIVKKIKQLLNE